eukprot:TRINITY_DN11258_c1_g2_i3.p2 TRINITY_DN11258_c1_g2~~TRINITY_DN11258_c1_g2_i3.p2  ORF type:complete len:257 (-),score=26.61 TRINITY_DN11258_c1_g2_i3:736-1506(-)
MWSLRKMRYMDQQFLSLVSSLIVNKKWTTFTPQNISNIMLTFADLGLKDQQVVGSLLQQFLIARGMNLQALSNLIYAMAVLESPVDQIQLVVQVLQMELQAQGVEKFKREELVMLRKAQLLMDKNITFKDEIETLAIKAAQEWVQEKIQLPNKLLSDVHDILSTIFPETQQIVVIEDGELDVHMTITGAKTSIVVQVLTQTAFTSTTPRIMLGTAKRHLEMLENLGWKVVYISTFDWRHTFYQDEIIKRIERMVNG